MTQLKRIFYCVISIVFCSCLALNSWCQETKIAPYQNPKLAAGEPKKLRVCMQSISKNSSEFQSSWHITPKRYWIGPEYWSNRLEDWQLNKGRLECINGKLQLRTVHLLTRALIAECGNLYMRVHTGYISNDAKLDKNAWTGFLIGAGSLDLDYRARALIHMSSGEGGGLIAALNGDGALTFYDNEDRLKIIPASSQTGQKVPLKTDKGVELRLKLIPVNGAFQITLSAYNENQKLLAESTIKNVDAARLTGNLALVANHGFDSDGASFWYENWHVSGSKVADREEQRYGPIYGVLYTLSKAILKLTAQFPPIGEADPQTAQLEISEIGTDNWKNVASASIVVPGWTATFKVSDWHTETDYDYRIIYALPDEAGNLIDTYYSGQILHDPIDKDEIVVAGFTGNLNTSRSFNIPWREGAFFSFTKNKIWFPHADLDAHVKVHQPDLLVYTGDQIYEGHPYRPDKSGTFNSYLNYLNKWVLFYWAHGDLTKNIPAITIPDDHDVFQINLWGAAGKKAREMLEDDKLPDRYRKNKHLWSHEGGGYEMPPEWINMVQQTQTSHLPDPIDPIPVQQGIGVYFTDMTYGGISFAILEDRKFKSSPDVLLPEAKILGGFPSVPNYDARKADHPNAILLGQRQLKFLKDWASDWKGAQMKVCISQTIFANVATKPAGSGKLKAGHGKGKPIPKGTYPKNHVVAQDFDSNGWPQTGRNNALNEIRKAFAFMIAGDQHLGSVVQHGIDDWEDAGYSFCVPAIANIAPRRWLSPKKGLNHREGMPQYTGRYFDGFGNRITVWAVANPYVTDRKPAELHDRATGYGIVRFNKKTQNIIIECWPRYVDPDEPNAKQFPGWPLMISMEDNYDRKAKAYLPTLKFTGLERPVVQVIDESKDEIVYTIRAKTDPFILKVFESGLYTIKVGEPGTDKMKTLRHIQATTEKAQKLIVVEF